MPTLNAQVHVDQILVSGQGRHVSRRLSEQEGLVAVPVERSRRECTIYRVQRCSHSSTNQAKSLTSLPITVTDI